MSSGRRQRTAVQSPARRRGYVLLPVTLLLGVIAALAFTLSREGLVGARLVDADALAQRARYVAEAGLAHARHVAGASACTGYALDDTPFGAHSYRATFTPDFGSPVQVTATGTLADGTTRTLVRRGVRVNDTVVTDVLQPGASEASDTYISQYTPTGNFGAANVFWLTTGAERPLLRFDLSGLPATAEILAAELSLHQISGGNSAGAEDFVAVHTVTAPWAEGSGTGNNPGDGATWGSSDGTASWTTPGGDYLADPLHRNFTVGGSGTKSWDVSTAVASWVAGTLPNHGLLLKGTSGIGSLKYHSSDASDPALHPKLTVTYACECGGNAQTTVLQPDGATARDTWVYEWKPTWNYGADSQIFVSNYFADSDATGFLEFDLSALPAAAVITGADLELYQQAPSTNGGTVSVRRVTGAWTEGSNAGGTGTAATWQEREPGVAWTTAGGDFAATDYGSASGGGGEQKWYRWDVTTLAQEWHAGTPNLGLALVSTASATDVYFTSSDGTNASRHPRLTLNWYCPCGADCSTGLAADAHYLDGFALDCTAPGAYAGSEGSLDWSTTAWTEVGDNDDPCAGSVRLESDAGDLRLRLGGGQGAERAVDLGEFASATLRLLVRANNVFSNERLSVEASADGVAWTEVGSVDGPADDTSYRSLAFDITAFASPDSRIRLTSSTGGAVNSFYVDDVRIDQQPLGGSGTAVTLGALADTYVYEQQPSASFGTDASVRAGKDGNGPGREYRALLRFDVASLPAGATVTAATLRLSATGGEGGNVSLELYRAGVTWDEGTATWTGTSGGTPTGSALDTASVSTTTPGWVEWSVPPALLHEWMDGVSPNDGLVLVSTSAKNRNALFASRENATLADRPQLLIEYTPP